MGRPLLLNDNFFSTRQFSTHTVTAEEEADGHEVWRVADGRRSFLDRWESTTANSDTWIKVRCGEVRGANVVVLDRGHNLTGHTVRVEASNDDFTTWSTLTDTTIPSAPGGTIDGLYGAVTEEGAWIYKFETIGAEDWRLFIPQMGAGLVPQVVGLWIGLAWQPEYAAMPYDEDRGEVFTDLTESMTGWQGGTRPVVRRQGVLILPMATLWSYEIGRRHVTAFEGRRPTWILYDDEEPERAVLAIRQPGQAVSFAISRDHTYRRGVIPWVELEPKVEL